MRTSKGLFIFILVLLLAAPAFSRETGKPVRIVVPAEVEAAGEEYFLGDIALLQGGSPEIRSGLAGLSLGRPPYAGTSRWLYRSYLELVLQRSGYAARSYTLEMPSQVKVYGAAQKLTGTALAETVYGFLEKRAKPEWKSWRLERLHLPDELLLPPGEVRVEPKINNPGEFSPGSLFLRLEIFVNGESYRLLPVTCRLRAEAEVFVAGRDLERLTVLTAADYRREIREVTGDELLTPPVPGAYRTTRPIRAGRILKARDLEPVPVICKGSKVRIIARGKAFFAAVDGLAQEDGGLGQEIAVKNIESGKVIRATVTGSGEVEVGL
ncbi:MAG: flagellar basal body P-ring formation protein FlgA [Firmicutes bacterium]|nr:flagellar basal body P-ring formation protein FlgA [Bacillota bacterium]